MSLFNKENIKECFDKTSLEYASKFSDELNHKPLEKSLLDEFASRNSKKGLMIDIGCGPGHISKYMYDKGIARIIGIDLSAGMIEVARDRYPDIAFEINDMMNLKFDDRLFGSAVAFYSVIYFDYEELGTALQEINRILKPKGELLFSFHVGDEVKHFDQFLGQDIQIDCHFMNVKKVNRIVEKTGFSIVKVMRRRPYPDIEFQSERAYFWVKK